jgi:hypothetical protein
MTMVPTITRGKARGLNRQLTLMILAGLLRMIISRVPRLLLHMKMGLFWKRP